MQNDISVEYFIEDEEFIFEANLGSSGRSPVHQKTMNTLAWADSTVL
jgi:hypothetical protein